MLVIDVMLVLSWVTVFCAGASLLMMLVGMLMGYLDFGWGVLCWLMGAAGAFALVRIVCS